MSQQKFLYQYSNKPLDEFVCDLCKYLTGIGCTGAALDVKVKVTSSDTTAGFLFDKIVSTDNSVTFTVLNPGANEQLDLSVSGGGGGSGVCCDLESITVADAQALIAGSTVIPNKLYLITDAYNDTCEIYLKGLNTDLFSEQGYGLFTNANTTGQVNALMKYNVVSDKVTEVYLPERNVRVTQSWDGLQSWGNSVDWYNFNQTGIANPETNVDIRDCTWNGPNPLVLAPSLVDSIVGTNCILINTVFNLNTTSWQIYDCYVYAGAIFVNDALGPNQDFSYNIVNEATITLNASYITDSTIMNFSTVVMTYSSLDQCEIKKSATVTLNENVFLSCKIGMCKEVIPAPGYNATCASIEDLDSTFEVFDGPDLLGVLDMTDYKFAGIVRIGKSGVPASWDLKQITNFPTDHIFSIVPADSNLVDVYDAGAGGNNIYLSVASVITYDGDKDDTLVVRSGLNNSSRLFQIGGWQAPSA